MNAKKYLNQIRYIDELIQSNNQEVKELKELYDSIAGTDYSKERVQESSESTDARFVKIVEKILELEEIIRNQNAEMLDLKLQIKKVINNLENNDEKLLIQEKYINFKTIKQISEEMHVSERTAKRIHKRALENIKVGTLCHDKQCYNSIVK